VSRGTQEPVQRASKTFVYGAVTLSGRSFQIVRLACWLVTRRPCGPTGPTTPRCKHHGLGSSAFARRYWRNHCCFLFLQVLRWFTSLRCLRPTYGFSRGYLRISRGGLPHSEIPGSKPVCGSPRLIAACHVLHRLLAPRHSPYALSSLTIRKELTLVGTRSSRLGTLRSSAIDPARPGLRRFPLAHCVCVVGKNYRLQDIQLSKITLGTASPNPSRGRSRGPHDLHSAPAGRSLSLAPPAPRAERRKP
jgi:hypothetical protein